MISRNFSCVFVGAMCLSACTGSGTDGAGGGGGGAPGPSWSKGDRPSATCSPAALTGDVFDPAEVYLAGTLSEGICGADAIAHWQFPDSAAVGFDCYFDPRSGIIRASDGRMIYSNVTETVLREFHCDGCPYEEGDAYPGNYLANDTVLETDVCGSTSPAKLIRLSPDGGFVQACADGWHDESGKLVYSDTEDDLIHLGYAHLALTRTSVVDLSTGESSPITGLPDRQVLTIRADESGRFLLVLGSDYAAELWSVNGAGLASLVGEYPGFPPEALAGSGTNFSTKLDACWSLYQFGYGKELHEDLIVRRTLDGASDVVYDEAQDPLVAIHISGLFTGP